MLSHIRVGVNGATNSTFRIKTPAEAREQSRTTPISWEI
jgi:hypothetical protein